MLEVPYKKYRKSPVSEMCSGTGSIGNRGETCVNNIIHLFGTNTWSHKFPPPLTTLHVPLRIFGPGLTLYLPHCSFSNNSNLFVEFNYVLIEIKMI